MVRTQIYFEDDMINSLRIAAKYNKTTVSEYIRQLISEKSIPQHMTNNKKVNPLLELVRLASKYKSKGRPTDVARNFDKYLPVEWQ